MDFLLQQNNLFILAVAIISGAMLAWPMLAKGRAGGGLSTEDAVRLINHKQAVMVDVRAAEAYQAGHIAQARSLPLAEIDQKAASLPKNKPLVVVCETGRDSAKAAAKLKAQGHAEVYVLEGGQQGWIKAGLPTTSGRKAA
ncbi:rhodanese-like domain-containing protein [Orrella sp. JC864]|uniref:rhodanese-like domain-containing protein n=1 Tax=Orrella sp. JC864 TaxID=3120298 RepID=UPI003008DD23